MAPTRSKSRVLALGLALIQLASPGLVAVADGLLQREAASEPATHIEASTRATCLAVHSPDCAMCRYISLSADPGPSEVPHDAGSSAVQPAHSFETSLWSRTPATARGRGPPAV